MEKVTSEVAETVWQKAGWYRAVTLTERIVSLHASLDSQAEKGTWNTKKAEQKLLQWKMQIPYGTSISFTERLATDSLTERELLALLSEPNEVLQARLSPPDWLVKLRSAFEDSSASADCPLPIQTSDGSRPMLAFLNAIRPLLNQGIQRLVAGINELAQEYAYLPFDQQTIVSLLFENLSQRLLSKLSRTFVLEMSVARVMGRLQGDTPEERFESFIQQLSLSKNILPLLEEYAVLARQLVVTIDHWVIFNLELLRHLCADWEQISATFTPGPGLLVEIRTGAGDTHRGGRSVTTLKFQSGFQLVYKPRSLAIDLHFQELLHWLNARGPYPPFQTFSVIDRGSYGWSAFIEARECLSEEEVQRFYERQGAYLALLYLLGAADLHAENIIAMGEYPVLIDLEALFHPHIGSEDLLFGREPASATLRHSVMGVGLLPQYIWGNEEARGIDMSGLGCKEGQLTPRAVPQWEDAGTDQMRLVRTRIKMAGSKNRPTLKGQSVDLLSYQHHLMIGFNAMYRTLLEHRDALLAEMLPRFARDEIRFVARPTEIYARFLHDSFRPELLRDALERERHFDRLWVGIEWQPHMARIIPAERSDLLWGDIPIFTTCPDSRNLFTSQGKVISAFLPQTSLDGVRKRVEQLGEQDYARQSWIIGAALTCMRMDSQKGLAPSPSSQPQQSELTPARWLAIAQDIGDEICRRAIYDRDRAGWLSICHVKEREWHVQAAGLDLYNGLPGITLFLAQLAEQTGKTRYLELARAALRTIQSLLQHPHKRQIMSCIGAFEGWGGLIYLFARLGALWNEPALFQEAEELGGFVRDLIEQEDSFDIMAGSAGCIAALLSLHTVAPSASILETAIACGDHLLAHTLTMQSGIGWKLQQQEHPLTGIAHGNAGIALSLLRLADRSGAKRFRQAALAAMDYERSLFSPERQNWPDLRKKTGSIGSKQSCPEEEKRFMIAWCHGAPGIALARMASLRFIKDDAIYKEIEHALTTTIAASEKVGSDPTMCHGVAGLLETLLTARQVLSHGSYTPHIEQLTRQLLAGLEAKMLRDGSQMAPWWMKVPGLMIGLAGIGYTLLRLAYPLRVPSVLTLAEPCFQQES